MRLRLFFVLIASLVLSLGSLSAAKLDSALAKIQGVGPKGAGSEAAAAAWKQLAQADAAQIPTLLATIDDENALAANWIRSAV